MPRPRRDARSLVMPPGRSIPRTTDPKPAKRSSPVSDSGPSDEVTKAAGELAWLENQISECLACARAGPQRAYGSGHPRASVLLLAPRPSPADLEKSTAFVEEAEALSKAFEALGMPLSSVYGSTAVRCGSAAPSSDEISACAHHLLVELEAIEPRAVVAFGPQAVEALAALDGRCGLAVPEDIPQGRPVNIRGDLVLLATEPLPGGLVQKEAKRRLWRDLRELKSLLDQDAPNRRPFE